MEKKIIASITNFIWPGIGYIYLGNLQLGIIILFSYILICFFLIQIAYIFPFVLILGLALNLFLAYHVYTTGEVVSVGIDEKVREISQRFQKIRYSLNMLESKINERQDRVSIARINSLKLRIDGANNMVNYILTNYNRGNLKDLGEYIKKTENFLKTIEVEQEQLFNLIYS
ncbi:MAG: hypothetical protein OH319_04090 [Candidatus Parvarchaeota archaeon]|nr:hypothetical protein [Candidatus Jingweiarchaeum tengchongense]MCW1298033.1 hypothetical protein [Candidatus Jingweiarchaeum tengchongense]MCW1300167.1 hypothetical protein [Candidatus Jingweiarchaeum tengchongense]MCW1304377.1 hypothetical protein [Candidatus Jingweiarchaeum tengchongense]MCW1305903.1 hypothetical protein [Candidatus Jingweiarchaeum tengchongense]